MTRSNWLAAALLSLAILGAPGVASACPNCKEGVATSSSPQAAGLQKGYYYSILFMIGMPIGVLSTGVFMVVRAVKSGALPEF